MSAEEPYLRVVRGNPTPEQIAALVAVLLEHGSEAGPAARPVPRARSAWANPAYVLHHASQRVPVRGSRVHPGA
jgi:Acyl-CoA carboxylase epsilon subunit